jgi:hypothetical protein
MFVQFSRVRYGLISGLPQPLWDFFSGISVIGLSPVEILFGAVVCSLMTLSVGLICL